MAKQAERRARTRGKLLEAAASLFESQGVDATSVDQLVDAAGVAKGTFYQHFESKAALVLALGRRTLAAELPALVAALASGRAGVDEIRRILARDAAFFEAQPELAEPLVQAGFQGAGRAPEAAEGGHRVAFTHIFRHMQAAGELRADRPVEELALYLSGSVAHTLLYWSRSGRRRPLAEHFEVMLSLFLDGARP